MHGQTWFENQWRGVACRRPFWSAKTFLYQRFKPQFMRPYEGIRQNAMKETLSLITHEDLSRVVIRLCLTAFPEQLRSLL